MLHRECLLLLQQQYYNNNFDEYKRIFLSMNLCTDISGNIREREIFLNISCLQRTVCNESNKLNSSSNRLKRFRYNLALPYTHTLPYITHTLLYRIQHANFASVDFLQVTLAYEYRASTPTHINCFVESLHICDSNIAVGLR